MADNGQAGFELGLRCPRQTVRLHLRLPGVFLADCFGIARPWVACLNG